MKANVSLAELEPSTGVPIIRRPQFAKSDTWVDVKSKICAFTVPANA